MNRNAYSDFLAPSLFCSLYDRKFIHKVGRNDLVYMNDQRCLIDEKQSFKQK